MEAWFKNVRNRFIGCQLVPPVNSVFLLSFCLCCSVISAEPCVITGHLAAVGRGEPAASDERTYRAWTDSLTDVNGRTFGSSTPAPRRSIPSHLSWPQSRTNAVSAETHAGKEQKSPTMMMFHEKNNAFQSKIIIKTDAIDKISIYSYQLYLLSFCFLLCTPPRPGQAPDSSRVELSAPPE